MRTPEVTCIGRGWREVRLGSVADIRFSNVDKKSEPGELPIRLCNYTDVYNNDYVTADMDFMRATATRTEIGRFGVQVGDVILTKDSETPDDIGVPTVIDSTAPDLVCGYHLAMIRPDPNAVDPTFLAKQLADWRVARYFGQQANGTTRYGLSTASIANIVLRLPPVEQQRAASRIVRLLDAAIAQTEAVIAKLKSVRAGLLHDLLTRGLDHNGALRPPPDQAPHLYKDSPLGRIPKEWEVEPLGLRLQASSGLIQTGPFGSQLHANEYTPDGIPVVMPQDICEGRVADDSIARIPTARAKELRRHRVRLGDMLFARRGDLSRCAVMTAREIGWLCGTGCLLMRFRHDSLMPDWLSLAYRHDRGQQQISARAVGTTMVNLNTTLLHHLIFAFPPVEEQRAVVVRLIEKDRLLGAEQQELEKARRLKSGLMSDLLTGRVRVSAGVEAGQRQDARRNVATSDTEGA